jgi:DNA-binding transcriptional MerR regulator
MNKQPKQPNKLYYTISEVAVMTGVKAHVLRYWESEFPTLRPRKTRSGSRRYRQRDIDEVLAIKKLLYQEGFRIAGARRVRKSAHREAGPEGQPASQLAIPFAEMAPAAQMAHIRAELTAVMALLRELASSKGPARAQPAGPGPAAKEEEA